MRNDDDAGENGSPVAGRESVEARSGVSMAERDGTAGLAPWRRLRSGSGLLLDWLLPVVCAGCERPLPPGHGAPGLRNETRPAPRGWCEACAASLPGLEARRCAVCGEASSATDSKHPVTCPRCRSRPPSFDRTIVLADYAPPLDHLVQAIKFDGQSALAAPLGRLMARAAVRACPAGTHHGADAIVPIPMAAARLSRRGYNQALLLARPIARALGLPIAPTWLRRVREGAPASSLDAGERHGMLARAFVAQRVTPGASVLVVDDVMTTGATLQAAAIALKAAGAAVVVNCVAARTPNPGPPVARRPALASEPEC